MIFDTNVLIYISKNIIQITDIIPADANARISVISYIEAMGFDFASEKDKMYMERICAACAIVPLSDAIIRETIKLRTHYRIKLPDAIIYATASVEGGPLFTNNISDFKNLPSKVELINPVDL